MGRPARLSRLGLAALAIPAAGVAFALGRGGPPPADLNRPLRTSAIDTCVRPRSPARTAAYASDGTRLPFTIATGHEPGTRPRCPDGALRILRLQALTIAGQAAYVRRGGCQQPCLVRQATVHVLAGDLARPVDLLPPAALGGDGGPAPGCDRARRAAPALAGTALGQMYYKTPGELRATVRRTGDTGFGARWSNYGDPGRRFGHADYGYLLWNLPRRRSGAVLPGGGIVEALIVEGQPVALCEVPTLDLPSFDAGGRRNGSVVFGYARVATTPPTHGWLLLGYRYRDRPFRATTTP